MNTRACDECGQRERCANIPSGRAGGAWVCRQCELLFGLPIQVKLEMVREWVQFDRRNDTPDAEDTERVVRVLWQLRRAIPDWKDEGGKMSAYLDRMAQVLTAGRYTPAMGPRLGQSCGRVAGWIEMDGVADGVAASIRDNRQQGH